MPECPFLNLCADRLESAKEQFEALMAGLTPEQASWRPSPGTWSVLQCVDHVDVSARLYFDRMRPEIERGRERAIHGSAPYGRGSLVGGMILRVLDPTSNRKFPAPGAFRPSSDALDPAAVDADFRDVVDTLLALMDRSDGLDLGRIRFRNPAFPVFKMTLAEGFEVHSLHIPRHIDQAERLTRSDGFPA